MKKNPDTRPAPSQKSGFTMVEVLIVVFLMAIMLAILLPSFKGIVANSRRKACSANMRLIVRALKLYSMDFNTPHPPGTNLREWYGALYYPSSSADPRPSRQGLLGGMTTMSVYTCPATQHLPPVPNAAGYFRPLVITATMGGNDSERPAFKGSALDYWVIRGLPATDYQSQGYPVFHQPVHMKTGIWPDSNAVLWETSNPVQGQWHHENGRNIAFKSENVRFIPSWDANDYPRLMKPDGTLEATTIAEGGNARYVHPNQ